MKHFALLLILTLAGYFAWAYASKSSKRASRKTVSKHLLPVLVILTFLIAGLAVMFYNRSINLL